MVASIMPPVKEEELEALEPEVPAGEVPTAEEESGAEEQEAPPSEEGDDTDKEG